MLSLPLDARPSAGPQRHALGGAVNKAQLIDHLSDGFGGRRQAAEALDQVLDAIQRSVTAGEKVVITGFGVFEKVDRPARTARNPATGERVKVKKTSVPKFRPGSDFKSFVSGAKKLPKAAAGGGAAAAKSTAKSTARKAAPAKTTGTTKAAAAKRTTAAKTSATTTTRKTAATKKTAPTKAATKSTAKKTAKSSAATKRATKKS
jgi:DNA-binding protein HU-beta